MKYRLVAGLLLFVTVLTSCGFSKDAPTGASTPGASSPGISSEDGSFSLTHSEGWVRVTAQGATIVLHGPDNCEMTIQRVPSDKKAGQTQAKVLESMIDDAEAFYSQSGGELEEYGRRVWMGQNYIWHEVHYMIRWPQKCPTCQDSYAIDYLALPSDTAEAVVAQVRCPGIVPISEKNEQSVLEIVDSLQLHLPGMT